MSTTIAEAVRADRAVVAAVRVRIAAGAWVIARRIACVHHAVVVLVGVESAAVAVRVDVRAGAVERRQRPRAHRPHA